MFPLSLFSTVLVDKHSYLIELFTADLVVMDLIFVVFEKMVLLQCDGRD